MVDYKLARLSDLETVFESCFHQRMVQSLEGFEILSHQQFFILLIEQLQGFIVRNLNHVFI